MGPESGVAVWRTGRRGNMTAKIQVGTRNAERGTGGPGSGRQPTNRQPVLLFRVPTSAFRVLFVSQRHDRIETRRPPRRPDAEEQSHGGAEHEGKQNGEGGDQRIPV